MHASHVDCPAASWYVPASHGSHTSAPAALTVPGLHSSCTVEPGRHAVKPQIARRSCVTGRWKTRRERGG